MSAPSTLPELPPLPARWSASNCVRCAACGSPYKPRLPLAFNIGTPTTIPGCDRCGCTTFSATIKEGEVPAAYTAEQMQDYARAAVAAALAHPTPPLRQEACDAAASDWKPGTWFQAQSVDEMQRFFQSRLPAIREAAREHGYAIGVHGSERRDFDLIAAPWRDGASDADTLARAIAIAACGITRNGAYSFEQKPLGRLATSIPICWTGRHGVVSDGHIDLSVMPAASPALAPHASQAKAGQDEQDRKDAERYRWLRDVAHPDLGEGLNVSSQQWPSWGKPYEKHHTGAGLDAAIDTAMASTHGAKP